MHNQSQTLRPYLQQKFAHGCENMKQKISDPTHHPYVPENREERKLKVLIYSSREFQYFFRTSIKFISSVR